MAYISNKEWCLVTKYMSVGDKHSLATTKDRYMERQIEHACLIMMNGNVPYIRF